MGVQLGDGRSSSRRPRRVNGLGRRYFFEILPINLVHSGVLFILPCEAKNCTVLYLQYLYQTSLYCHNFWCTYITINLLSPVCFIFFVKLKTVNQLKFQQYSTLAHCSHTVFKLLCREMTYVFIAPKTVAS